jgi:outer membrane protein assembly factor BamB
MLIVAGADRQLTAVKWSTGEKVWSYQAPEVVQWSGVTVFGDKLIAGSFEGWVHVLDAPTGKFEWRYDVGGSVMGSPVVHEDRFWILTKKGSLLSFSLRGRLRTDEGVAAQGITKGFWNRVDRKAKSTTSNR